MRHLPSPRRGAQHLRPEASRVLTPILHGSRNPRISTAILRDPAAHPSRGWPRPATPVHAAAPVSTSYLRGSRDLHALRLRARRLPGHSRLGRTVPSRAVGRDKMPINTNTDRGNEESPTSPRNARGVVEPIHIRTLPSLELRILSIHSSEHVHQHLPARRQRGGSQGASDRDGPGALQGLRPEAAARGRRE